MASVIITTAARGLCHFNIKHKSFKGSCFNKSRCHFSWGDSLDKRVSLCEIRGYLEDEPEEKIWEGRNEDGWGEDRGTVRLRYGSYWFHCLDRQFIQLEGPCAVSDGGSEGWSAECVYLWTLLDSRSPLNGRFWHREMKGMRDWDATGTRDAKCLRLRLFSSFG